MAIEFNPSSKKTCDSECPICFSSKNKNHILNVPDYSGVRHLFYCDDCGASFFFPFPEIRNYEIATENIAAVRHYVEVGVGIEWIIKWIFKAIQPDIKGKFLDVGCGFGFCLDLVRHNSNWEVVGADPSNYAKLGAEWLNLTVHNSYIQDVTELKGKKFDCIFSSEVIEHVPDPYSFMKLLGEYMEPSGIMVITTPNADFISEETDENLLNAILNPNEHLILYSSRSIKIILEKIGYKYYFIESHGSHLVFYASQRKFHLKQSVDNIVLEKAYYSSLLRQGVKNPYIKIGVGFRYFKLLIQSGEYAEATKLFEELYIDFSGYGDYDDASNMIEFGKIMPYCIPVFAFYRGIHLLNHINNFEEAARLFALSYDLCLKVITIMPSCCIEEKQTLWRAKFHEVLALFKSGNYSEARNVMKQFSRLNETMPGVIETDRGVIKKFKLLKFILAFHNSLPKYLQKMLGYFLNLYRYDRFLKLYRFVNGLLGK